MDRVDDVTDKLNAAEKILVEILKGVSPIVEDYHNIRSSDDQYECMDYPWASVTKDGVKEILLKIDNLRWELGD